MDKKSIVAVSVLGILLVVIIIGVFMFDSSSIGAITEINRVKYSKSDFESYLKVWQHDNGDTPVDLDTMYGNFKIYKLYTQYVDMYDIELPSGEQIKALTEEEKAELENDYNLSESEYMRVKTEIAEVDYLFENLYKYWIVSDEEYKEHQTGNEDLFKMYDYRIMQVSVEEPEKQSGDVSGDTSGDVSGDNTEEARKNKAKSRAVEALAKVKSGDSFEEVAKEYGTNRIAYANGGYTIVNGTLETASGLYMDNYVWDENVKKALTTLSKGEYSEILEDKDGNYYTFVYLENVREGLDEEDSNTYKRQIANEHIQGEALFVDNRISLKSMNLEKLIPALTKKDETSGDKNDANSNTDSNTDSNNNTDNAVTSGDNNTQTTTSGDENSNQQGTITGEIILSGDAE